MIDFETATLLNLNKEWPMNIRPTDLDYALSYDVSARPDPEFVEALHGIYKTFGLKTDALHISTSYGTYGAYRLLSQMYKIKTLYKTPNGSRRHENAFATLGVNIVHLDQQDGCPYPTIDQLQAIESAEAMLYINATDGRFPESDYIAKLFSVIKQKGLVTLIDLDSQFLSHDASDAPIQKLLQYELPDECLVVCTLSKEFGLPGLRYGYIVSTEKTGKRIDSHKYDLLEMEPHLVKHLAATYIGFDQVMANVRTLHERYESLVEYLKKNNIGFITPNTGVNVFIRSKNAVLLREKLRERNIRVGLGEEWGSYKDCVRWTLSHDVEIQTKALAALVEEEGSL